MHFSGQFKHGILPDRAHDEAALEDFILNLKKHVQINLGPGNKLVYNSTAKNKFKKRNSNKNPSNRQDVASVMKEEPYWQFYSSLNRAAQESMWDTFGSRSERQLPNLIELSKSFKKNKKNKGSIKLNPKLKIPTYNSKIDIHIQPGAYHTDLTKNDVYSGALYDTAVYVYTLRGIGNQNEDLGLTTIEYLKKNFPKFSPEKILDMGCAVGHSTVPYCDAFPKADIFAIDIAAPMLRYAHARAESMNKKINFEQRNAEKTGYKDCSFDLIVSHILFHETSSKALPSILKECYRLLKKGGMMIHAEVPAFNSSEEDPYDHFARDWSTHYNAEPFWGKLHEMNLTEHAINAGFDKNNISEGKTPSVLGGAMVNATAGKPNAVGGSMVRNSWYVLQASK